MFLESLLLVGAYVMGSVPFGLLLTEQMGITDLRQRGSGNIGATNVLRVAGRSAALLTLVFDVLKGALPVFLASCFAPHIAPVGGLFAVLGHVFPVFLHFRGGKGVATAFGVMLVLSRLCAFTILVIWILVVFFTRYASLASLCAVAACPFVLCFVGGPYLVMTSLILVGLIFYTHRKNIRRLFLRSEFKVEERGKS